MSGVLIRDTDVADPRFSRPQLQALIDVAAADPAARLLGLDYAHRPVVEARLGIPRATRVYAIQRNGDPTDPKTSDFSAENFLKERWGS